MRLFFIHILGLAYILLVRKPLKKKHDVNSVVLYARRNRTGQLSFDRHATAGLYEFACIVVEVIKCNHSFRLGHICRTPQVNLPPEGDFVRKHTLFSDSCMMDIFNVTSKKNVLVPKGLCGKHGKSV